jgi:spore coat protein U-like protein
MSTRLIHRACVLLILLGLVAGFRPPLALAAHCTVTTSNLNFGSIRIFQTTQFQSLGYLTFRCNGRVKFVRITASAGVGASGSQRKLATPSGPGHQLAYELSLDAAGTRPWGDGTNSTAPFVQANPPHQTDVMVPIFGRLRTGTAGVDSLYAGAYTDTVSVQITWQ